MKNIIFALMGLVFGTGLFAQTHIQQVRVSPDINFVQHSVTGYEDNYVVVGTVLHGPISGDSDLLVLMADNAGTILWSRYVDYGNDEFAGAVITDQKGHIVLTGYVGDNGTRNKDLIVVKLDSKGNYVNDAVITDADLLNYGLYGMDLAEITGGGYIVVGTGVDGATQVADKYAFVLNLSANLKGINWGRVYKSDQITPFIPTYYDSFNHILKVPDHPQHGEVYLLTGSGANDFNNNQMVVNDLIDPATGLSVWNTQHAQGNGESNTYDSRGVMALYNEAMDRFFVLYYGQKNIPSLLDLDGTTGSSPSSAYASFYFTSNTRQNNIFSGMQWNPDKDGILLSGYHIEANDPPGIGYPILLRYGLFTNSDWLKYNVFFDGSDYLANTGFDFVAQPLNSFNPNPPYFELNQIYYHPKSMLVKTPGGTGYVFAAPYQHPTTLEFGLNLLNTGPGGETVCMESFPNLIESAPLGDYVNFSSIPYNFRVVGPGADVINARLLNNLTCNGTGRPAMGANENTGGTGIGIYPNPASDAVHVFGLSGMEKVKITLYDLQGREVLSRTLDPVQSGQSARLDISSLTNGVYLLKFTEAGKSVFVEKVVKE